MYKTIVLLLTFIGFNLRAQEISPRVKRLASRITNNISTDSLKVRALFEWVTDNISYDTEMAKAKDDDERAIEAQNPENVIKREKATCMGYSQLFRDLCLASGIKAYYVVGYSKELDLRTGKLVVSRESHAWNVVKINGLWYLCDPTWSTYYVNSQPGIFSPQRTREFYLADPQSFVKTHLPYDPLWQLTDRPVSVEGFHKDIKPAGQLKFNYADSLCVFEALCIDQQKLNSNLRRLQYNPTDDGAKFDVGYYFSQKAENDAKTLGKLLDSFINKKNNISYKRALEEKNLVYSLLRSHEKNLNQARDYFQLIPSKSIYRPVAKYNLSSVSHNLNVNKRHKANLTRYYKVLEKMKL